MPDPLTIRPNPLAVWPDRPEPLKVSSLLAGPAASKSKEALSKWGKWAYKHIARHLEIDLVNPPCVVQ